MITAEKREHLCVTTTRNVIDSRWNNQFIVRLDHIFLLNWMMGTVIDDD